ncbi:heavy-metal-associated domain-containing protein [Massilia phyllostachyos]|nr:cation transporter [Massilia phyllostachyos]
MSQISAPVRCSGARAERFPNPWRTGAGVATRRMLDLPTVATLMLAVHIEKRSLIMQFHLDDMTCGGCARSVTKAIQSVDAHAVVATDPPARLVTVETSAPRAQIAEALREAGFPPRES